MGSILELWGAVLDRSFEQIAAASADAREFDRHLVIQVSDVWDNNTYPFFGAAVARGARREVLAADGIGRMANFGPDRRAWVVEQVAASGGLVSLPPESYPAGIHYRDYRGLVRPIQVPLTSEVATEVVADCDLTTANVRDLLLERSGGGLRGSLLLTVDRRFGIDQRDAPSAELDLRFEGINDLRFDLDDSDGIAIDRGVALTIGRNASFVHPGPRPGFTTPGGICHSPGGLPMRARRPRLASARLLLFGVTSMVRLRSPRRCCVWPCSSFGWFGTRRWWIRFQCTGSLEPLPVQVRPSLPLVGFAEGGMPRSAG